jgi:glycine/D-amino acid oxidase-like deaminating enzyme
MIDVAVVGAGLFGSIIAAELRRKSLEVVVLDDARPESGSKPAACLMKPSWLAGLGKEVTQPAQKVLETLYGIETIKFKTGPISTSALFCDPRKILLPPDQTGSVYMISKPRVDTKFFYVNYSTDGKRPGPIIANNIVLCTGIWATDMVSIEGGLQAQAGISFLWPKGSITQPIIKPWAPYKQTVAFNRGDGLWVGDGSAIKRENWTAQRTEECLVRCRKVLGDAAALGAPVSLFGIRPYSKMKPCYLKQQHPGFWVATGGAKSGMTAAAWCAHTIAKEMGL